MSENESTQNVVHDKAAQGYDASLKVDECSLEADDRRQALERDQLLDKFARREARIAVLSETLERVEVAMGQPAPVGPAEAARPMPDPEPGSEG